MTYSYDSINSMELESNTFVYAIGTRDDQGLLVYRYVGLTSRGATRLKQHLWGAKTVGSNTYNTYKAKWIRTVDFNVEFIVLEYCNSFEELTLCEQKWIAILKARGYKLTNLTNGGDGSLGWCPSPETRAKWSQNISGEKNPNWKGGLPPKKKARIPRDKWGNVQPKSEEHRKKISDSRKGQNYGPHVQWHVNRQLCKLDCFHCRNSFNGEVV